MSIFFRHKICVALFLFLIPAVFPAPSISAAEPAERTAYYVASTHWDREWYEPFQGFRMRLVSLFDEAFDTFEKDPVFKTFTTDGQTIPLYDYLEIRPEKRALVEKYMREGRLKSGPWYVLPDEFIVSGESLVRNLQTGMLMTTELGGKPSHAGFACDLFGHTGQLPQIFDQMGIPGALVWRGTLEKELHGHFNWRAPDGTIIPTYRFGKIGYCTYTMEVRKSSEPDVPFKLGDAVDRLVEFVPREGARSPLSPILLFDGGDHIEIEPQSSALFARANEKLKAKGFTIVHSDLDAYFEAVLKEKSKITKTVTGELRESYRDPDDAHLIPGVLSSRIHLKQRNAACEDELCLWAEPFSAFAAPLGQEYPDGFLRVAWKHLLENHPHDSICGCSIDQVHQDMIYRFDQSLGISSRLTGQALKTIALAAAPKEVPEGALLLTVFNSTAEDIAEPIDIDIPLPSNWPKRFQEFFGYEEKFSFRLTDVRGKEIPHQLDGQQRDRAGFTRVRYKFPSGTTSHVVTVTAPLTIPAFGYTTLVVKPVDGPTRYLGSLAVSHNAIENEFLRAQVESNGSLTVTDKRSGKRFEGLLTFEDRADIGDGWFHGMAVNDRIHTSVADAADVALVSDGPNKAVLRITVTMNVPREFNFKDMVRSAESAPLVISSDVTLRKGADRVEVTTIVQNTILDHRVRVLFPTGLKGDSFLSDAAFDVVRRPIALASDNASRIELDVETRPHQTWTAFGEPAGLAVVSRGLPESAVIDTAERPIALTLFRAFRRAVLANDNPGGQIQGPLTFRYCIVPYSGGVPAAKLFRLGQRVNSPTHTVCLGPGEYKSLNAGKLPAEYSFLNVAGNAVVTSVQRNGGALHVRLFNPGESREKIVVQPSFKPATVKSLTLDGRDDTRTSAAVSGGAVELTVPGKRIATVRVE